MCIRDRNIPVRTELGAELRKMFVAPAGRVLVDADYSQIELRLLAHIAGDEHMIAAFRTCLLYTSSMARNILQMALPMTVAQLINILYNVVDRMYLGKLPGHLSLTGLGLCLPIISILMGFANLCGMGGAPLCLSLIHI